MPEAWLALVVGVVALSVPLLLAAMGGLTSERAGVMNIALEGKMLVACCSYALAATASGNALVGLGAGLLAAVLLSGAHWVFTQVYRMDPIVSGMGINLVALGGTSYLGRRFMELLESQAMPTLPVGIYWVAAVGLTAGLAWALGSTRAGLHLVATGADPDKARQMGLDPARVRAVGLVATGVLTGLAGVLIVSNAGSFVDGMTSGRGFIALAALILGGWRPWPTLAACVVFGLFLALQLQLQGTAVAGVSLPSEFWQALPYLVTLVALGGFVVRSRPPAGMGRL